MRFHPKNTQKRIHQARRHRAARHDAFRIITQESTMPKSKKKPLIQVTSSHDIWTVLDNGPKIELPVDYKLIRKNQMAFIKTLAVHSELHG